MVRFKKLECYKQFVILPISSIIADGVSFVNGCQLHSHAFSVSICFISHFSPKHRSCNFRHMQYSTNTRSFTQNLNKYFEFQSLREHNSCGLLIESSTIDAIFFYIQRKKYQRTKRNEILLLNSPLWFFIYIFLQFSRKICAVFTRIHYILCWPLGSVFSIYLSNLVIFVCDNDKVVEIKKSKDCFAEKSNFVHHFSMNH